MRKRKKGEESVTGLVVLGWPCSQRAAGSHAANSVRFLGCEVLPDKQGLAGGGKRGWNSKPSSLGVLLLAPLAPVTDMQELNYLRWCWHMGLRTNPEKDCPFIFWLQKH